MSRHKEKPPESILDALKSRTIETSGGCWEWLGSKTPGGYGRITRRYQRQEYKYAHRLMFALTRHPPNLWVLHACDNPSCINPEHLFEGTPQDNAQDRETKGRGRQSNKGSIYPVDDIKGLHQLGWGPKKISEFYAMPKPSVDAILYQGMGS